jgi:hypothetical protein
MMILTEANSKLVYQSALAATSTLAVLSADVSSSHLYWLVSCHSRHLRSEWESGQRKWEFSLSVSVGLQELFYML